MAGFLSSLITDFQVQMERHRNRPFLRGAMGACALVASADGAVSFSERVRIDQIVETLEALKVFDPHEAVDLFNEFTDAILEDPKSGRAKALEAIQSVGDNPETAQLLIRICIAVSEAKSEKLLVDQIEIVMLCGVLGVDSKEFGLYADEQ